MRSTRIQRCKRSGNFTFFVEICRNIIRWARFRFVDYQNSDSNSLQFYSEQIENETWRKQALSANSKKLMFN